MKAVASDDDATAARKTKITKTITKTKM